MEIVNISNFDAEKNKRVFIRKSQRKNNFYQIHNDCAEDEDLSSDGLAVISYLMKKPEDWKIRAADLCRRFKWENKKTYRVLNELKNLGYMRRVCERSDSGKIDCWVTEISDERVFLDAENREPENPVLGEMSPLSQKGKVVKNHPLSQKPLSAKRETGDLIYTNKDLDIFKTTTTRTDLRKTKKQEEIAMRYSNAGVKGDELVVVLNFLVQEGVAKGIAEDLVAKYGLVRGQVVMKGFKSLPVRPNNPGAWLRAAFEKEFKFEEPKKRNEKPLVARSAHTRYVGPNVEETRRINALREEEAKTKSTFGPDKVREILKPFTKHRKGDKSDVEN